MSLFYPFQDLLTIIHSCRRTFLLNENTFKYLPGSPGFVVKTEGNVERSHTAQQLNIGGGQFSPVILNATTVKVSNANCRGAKRPPVLNRRPVGKSKNA